MPEKRKPARNLATSVSEEPAMRAQGAPSMAMAWWWPPHASNSAAAQSALVDIARTYNVSHSTISRL
jgi:hypothetical protein